MKGLMKKISYTALAELPLESEEAIVAKQPYSIWETRSTRLFL